MKRKGCFLKGVAGAMALCLALAFPTPVNAQEDTGVSSQSSGTVIFQDGKTNESYESDNGDWLLKASDEDVITVVYSCTDKDHAGWGVLGWGATVDDAWKDGPSLSASETNAEDTMVASMTVADFKKTMGITDKSVITCLKLGAWNGGKIESITVSAKGEAPKVEGAEEIVLEAPKDLEGDYLYLLTEPTTIGIYPNDYCLGANPGITIYLTIEMESNGPFGGGIGICVNEWLWYQKEYSSDDQNKCTLELFITPLQNCFQFQVWWMGGTQLGIKSITVEKAVDYRVPAAQQEPVRDPSIGGTTPAAPTKFTHTFTTADRSDVTFNLNDYVSDLAIGDQVKITISAKGDSSKGWYGYQVNLGVNSKTDSEQVDWTTKKLETYNKEDLTDSLTITVPYNSNNVMVQCWDIQGSDIDVEVTFEKL